MSTQVELMKIFCDASSARGEAVRNGDLSEAWKQSRKMNTVREMAVRAAR